MVLCFSAVLAWILHDKFVSNQKQQKWKQRNKLIGGYLGIGTFMRATCTLLRLSCWAPRLHIHTGVCRSWLFGSVAFGYLKCSSIVATIPGWLGWFHWFVVDYSL